MFQIFQLRQLQFSNTWFLYLIYPIELSKASFLSLSVYIYVCVEALLLLKRWFINYKFCFLGKQILMAGLQYNFFPTDFFFPRQQTVTREGSNLQQNNLLVNTRTTEDSEDAKQLKSNGNSKSLKAVSSSSLALAPVLKRNSNPSSNQ